MRQIVQVEFLEIEEEKQYISLIQKVIKRCFEEENLLQTKLYISIILTNPQNIQRFNLEYRKVNKQTDVLSFPMFEKEELEKLIEKKPNKVQDVLGDIIISLDQVGKQASEYGHSFERELSYMLVHGFYHLMGYDHIEEKDKLEMRPKEEKILQDLKITRN